MCGVEHGVCIFCASGKLGQGCKIYVYGLLDVVDGNSCKFTLGCNNGNVALRQRTFDGVCVTVGVGVVTNLYCLSVGDVDGVCALNDNLLGEQPTATGVVARAALPQTKGVGTIVGVAAYTAVPVEVLVGAARCGARLDVVAIAAVGVNFKILSLLLRFCEFYKIFSVVVRARSCVCEPLISFLAVDVVTVALALCCVERKKAVVLGCLCGGG